MTNLHAFGWHGNDGHGRVGAAETWARTGPMALPDASAVTACFGRPVKYFSRLTSEARNAMIACRLALLATGSAPTEQAFGLIAAGYDGQLAANLDYFTDYVTHGRTLGRGNLFIYTLPSSTLGEIGIALALTGPAYHCHDPRQPVRGLLAEAALLLERHEAAGVLALWSELTAAICVACLPGPPGQLRQLDSGWLDDSASVATRRLTTTFARPEPEGSAR